MSIGQRVKEQRKKTGLTQPKLASEIGISLDMVKSIETDRVNPSIETLGKLAVRFGCTSDYLIGNSDDPTYLKSGGNFEHVMIEIAKLSDEERNRLVEMIVRTTKKQKNGKTTNRA